MRKTIITLLTFILLIGGATVVLAKSTYQLPQSASNNVKITGGVIRIDPKGVYLHTNSTHHSIGIKSVYIDKNDGSLVVVSEKGNPVVTTSVTPDETIAKKGITVGLSGGGKYSKVFFYKNGKQLKLNSKQFNEVASPTSNIWFMVVSHESK